VIPMKKAGFPEEYWREDYSRIALEDCLLRRFSQGLAKCSFKAKGSGKSGLVGTSRPGQEILHRSAMVIAKNTLTARFEVGFPANGRTVNSNELAKILFDLLPPVVVQSLYYRSWRREALQKNYELSVDQHFIREELPKRKLVAFLVEGSVLPRVSGVSDRPLADAVPLSVPETLRVEMDLPYHGKTAGLGIPEGVTLIIGGGYHGKSTLLQALEQGVYNHIAGDGREYAVTEENALKLRAEDGRSVKNLDLSLFIHNLPNGKDTKRFSTADASGSTSQAAAVMEGVEMGSHTFLIDEDTSATNFLVRDEFMQKIVHGDKEPITPFCARVRDLYEKAGISTVLVAGSSGAFFHMADTVIQMDSYRPLDVKKRVEAFLPEYPLPVFEAEAFLLPQADRAFWGSPARRDDRMKTKVISTDGFSINHETVDLRYVEQLVDSEQMAALAGMMRYVLTKVSGPVTVKRLAGMLMSLLERNGLEAFMEGYAYCGTAAPRIQEIYAMLNRYRGKYE
ncbi:MAG: ABC-ATPase domain-containing protein, partial [Clostridiales bacterium]|nr:ABC-ATPase domain-containing protein [Clostridiales bacterium]